MIKVAVKLIILGENERYKYLNAAFQTIAIIHGHGLNGKT